MKTSLFALKYSELYLIIPIFIILIPTFPTIFHGLMGFQIVFAIEIFTIIVCMFKGVFKPRYTLSTFVIVCYYLSSTVLSLLFDLVRSVITVSDFFEIIKPISFLLFYWFYRYSIINVDIIIKFTQKAILFIFVFLALFSILSFLYPQIFGVIELFLYKRSSVPILANKAIGSFSTTYHFAFCLLLLLAYSFIGMIRFKNIKYSFLFIIFLCAMLLTQSRSMYLCSIICIFICSFVPILHRTFRQSFSTIMLFVILLLLVCLIFIQYHDEISTNLAYAYQGLAAISDGNNNSVNVRENQINWAFQNNFMILTGSGIGKGEIMLESFYSLYYYRYGIIGIILFLFIVIYVSYKSFLVAKYYEDNTFAIFFYSLAIFYLISPLAIMSSCHMDSPKISFLFYGLIGLILNKYHMISKQPKNHDDSKNLQKIQISNK